MDTTTRGCIVKILSRLSFCRLLRYILFSRVEFFRKPSARTSSLFYSMVGSTKSIIHEQIQFCFVCVHCTHTHNRSSGSTVTDSNFAVCNHVIRRRPCMPFQLHCVHSVRSHSTFVLSAFAHEFLSQHWCSFVSTWIVSSSRRCIIVHIAVSENVNDKRWNCLYKIIIMIILK